MQNTNLANPGVRLKTGFNAIYSASRLKANTKTTAVHVCEAHYAKDAAFCSHSKEQLQYIMESFSNICQYVCLKISTKETIIMSHGTEEATIMLSDEALETVENFSYLGSITSKNVPRDEELNTQIGNAATSTGRLATRV